MRKKTCRWFRFFWIIPYVLVAKLETLAGGREIEDLYRCIWGILFGTVSFETRTTFVFAAEAAGFLVIFGILYGQILSEPFFQCGIYIFSRNPYRKPYLMKRMGYLYLVSFAWSALYFISNLLILAAHSVTAVDRQCVELTVFQMLYFSLILYDLVLCVNALALKINPNVACGIGIGFLYLLVYSAMFLQRGVPLILNPFCIPVYKLGDSGWLIIKMGWIAVCTAVCWYMDFYEMCHYEWLKSEGVV